MVFFDHNFLVILSNFKDRLKFIFFENSNLVWAFLSLENVFLKLLDNFFMNTSVLDYLIDWKVLLKHLLNLNKFFLIDSIEIVYDGAFMLLVENEKFLGVHSTIPPKKRELLSKDFFRKLVNILWLLELTGVKCIKYPLFILNFRQFLCPNQK